LRRSNNAGRIRWSTDTAKAKAKIQLPYFLGDFMEKKHVHQCLKCWHIWEIGKYLRKDGTERKRCPRCNSNQTVFTELNPTRIVVREDLLMLTEGQYPYKYCPKTSAEELFGHQGDIVNENGVRIFVSRGWADRNYGHYVYLIVDKKLWMTTDKDENESIMEAVKECPNNARVFIAGLGLGLVLLHLAKSRKAREVLVVEIEPRVIKYVEPRVRKWLSKHYPDFNWKVICGNALEEVSKHGKFDWIFFDIWSGRNPRKGEPSEDEVISKALPYLTPRGKLTLWTRVVRKIEERRFREALLKLNFLGEKSV